MGIETMSCSKCGTPYKRYTSKEIEQRHRRDSKALGIQHTTGVLACPKCLKLKPDEHWVEG